MALLWHHPSVRRVRAPVRRDPFRWRAAAHRRLHFALGHHRHPPGEADGYG